MDNREAETPSEERCEESSPKKSRRSTAEERQEAIQRVKNGDSYAVIGKSMGFSPQSVSKWYKKYLTEAKKEQEAGLAPPWPVESFQYGRYEHEVEYTQPPPWSKNKPHFWLTNDLRRLARSRPDMTLEEWIYLTGYNGSIEVAQNMLKHNNVHYHTAECLYPQHQFHPKYKLRMYKCQPPNFYENIYKDREPWVLPLPIMQ